MIPRALEPEAMDTAEEAREYDAMDHSAVNAAFVADFLAARGESRGGRIVDLGCGTGRIAILIARADPLAHVVAIDIAEHMLTVARENIQAAGLSDRIELVRADAKGMNEIAAGSIAAVVSNSIVHHIPDPSRVLAEIVRVLEPGGIAFVRDLFRPDSAAEVDRLVSLYAGNETERARGLFRVSLGAALTLAEVRETLERIGVRDPEVAQTSDRHWTWTLRKSN